MPADYINKLLRMLQDIEINKDLNKAFKSTHTLSNNNRNAIAGKSLFCCLWWVVLRNRIGARTLTAARKKAAARFGLKKAMAPPVPAMRRAKLLELLGMRPQLVSRRELLSAEESDPSLSVRAPSNGCEC